MLILKVFKSRQLMMSGFLLLLIGSIFVLSELTQKQSFKQSFAENQEGVVEPWDEFLGRPAKFSEIKNINPRENIAVSQKEQAFLLTGSAWSLPLEYSLKSHAVKSPVKDQQYCGACGIFGIVHTIETNESIFCNRPGLSLAPQELVSCMDETISSGSCEYGWSPWWVLEYIGPSDKGPIQNNGIVAESCFPYTGSQVPCNKCSDDPTSHLESWEVWDSTYDDYSKRTEEEYVQWFINQGGAVAMCYRYSGTVYHCVEQIGFAHQASTGNTLYEIKNSFGLRWGDDGYGFIDFVWPDDFMVAYSMKPKCSGPTLTPTPTPTPAPKSVSATIINGKYDVEEGCEYTGGGSRLSVGVNVDPNCPSTPHTVGLRFENLNIPLNETVTYAYLKLTSADSFTNSMVWRIYAEKSATPQALAPRHAPSTWQFTSNYSTWDINTNWHLGGVFSSPNIAPVINEAIAGRSSQYVSINLALRYSSGSENRSIISLESCDNEGCSYKPAELVVYYSGGPEPTTSPTPTPPPGNPIPNCSNISGPSTLTLGESGTYSADFFSEQGNLGGGIFYNNLNRIEYQDLPGTSGSFSTEWQPPAEGTYNVCCRAWNDAIAECRPQDLVDGPPRYDCQGPNYCMTVSVVKTSLPGDINGDDVVNIQDYILLSNAFGTDDKAADLNNDGIVNIQDYIILSNNFGRS